jgi:hypothetical protein
VVAILALVLGIPIVVGSAIQNLVLWTALPMPDAGSYPAEAVRAVGAFRFRAGIALLLGLTTVSAGWGLRKRREWARRLTAGLFCVGALLCAAVPFVGLSLAEMSRARDGSYEAEGAVLWVATVVISLIPVPFLLWVAKRFASSDVRGEFRFDG